MRSTSASAPRSAARAPRMANDVGFDVAWLWSEAALAITAAGPRA